MKHIFIDFEMQPIPKIMKEQRKVCTNEIIEIGAVAYDDDMEEVSCYKEYVKPEYAPKVSAWVRDLTGISGRDLICAKQFEAALNGFADWCRSLDDEIRVYAWSNADYLQVTREAKLKGIEQDEEMKTLLSGWIDFQKMFGNMVGAKDPVSLEKALSLIGIRFEGSMHDALWDARNTAELYKASQEEENLIGIAEGLRAWCGKSETPANTMGSMIDFSEILAAIA